MLKIRQCSALVSEKKLLLSTWARTRSDSNRLFFFRTLYQSRTKLETRETSSMSLWTIRRSLNIIRMREILSLYTDGLCDDDKPFFVMQNSISSLQRASVAIIFYQFMHSVGCKVSKKEFYIISYYFQIEKPHWNYHFSEKKPWINLKGKCIKILYSFYYYSCDSNYLLILLINSLDPINVGFEQIQTDRNKQHLNIFLKIQSRLSWDWSNFRKKGKY